MKRDSEFVVRDSVVSVGRGGGYETLDVYRLAFDLAVEMHGLTVMWPKIEQFGGLADQLRRSSKSICANLAEGLSKRMSEADERRFISMALGSAEECRVWLDFAVKLDYLPSQRGTELREDYKRVCQMLFRLQEKRQAA